MRAKRFTFEPHLTITGSPGDFVIAFHSNTKEDKFGTPHLVRVTDCRSIYFGCSRPEPAEDMPELMVMRVSATLQLPDGSIVDRLVAPMAFDAEFARVNLERIYDGLKQAATTAILAHQLGASGPTLASGGATVRATAPRGGGTGWKTAGVALAGVIVAGLGIAAVRSRQPPPGPAETLAARTLLADPSTVDAQIELNNQVLKSMGLDPGTAADMGCLAAPPTAKHE